MDFDPKKHVSYLIDIIEPGKHENLKVEICSDKRHVILSKGLHPYNPKKTIHFEKCSVQYSFDDGIMIVGDKRVHKEIENRSYLGPFYVDDIEEAEEKINVHKDDICLKPSDNNTEKKYEAKINGNLPRKKETREITLYIRKNALIYTEGLDVHQAHL